MHRALVIDNKLCYQRDVERKQLIHKKKLESMKSTAKSNSCHQMDNNRPKRHRHLEQNAKKRQLEDEHYAKIERENRILIEKMYSIMNSKAKPNAMEFQPGMRLNSNQGPMVDCYLSPRSNFPGAAVPHRSLNTESRKREHDKIMDENMQILKRLQEKKPVYSTKALHKERKIVEGYMSNISNSTTTGYLPSSPTSRGAMGSQMSWGTASNGFGSVSAGAGTSAVSAPNSQLAPIRPKGKKRPGKKSAREAKLEKGDVVDDAFVVDKDTEAAALKIQAISRGRETRKSMPVKKTPTAEEDNAAAKLQAMQRGKLTRKKAAEKKEEDSAATKLQAIQRGKNTRHKREQTEQAYAATKLQAMQRGKNTRKVKAAKTEEDGAATKLQAIQRGKNTRKAKQEKAEQDKAAILLQAKQRRNTAKAKVDKLKEEKEQEEAAVKIQAIKRRKQSQAQAQDMKDQNSAAIKIQAVKRKKDSMTKVENMKKGANSGVLLHKAGIKISGTFCYLEIFKGMADDKAASDALYILVRVSSPRNEFRLECKVDDEEILKTVGDQYGTISEFLSFDDAAKPQKLLCSLGK